MMYLLLNAKFVLNIMGGGFRNKFLFQHLQYTDTPTRVDGARATDCREPVS